MSNWLTRRTLNQKLAILAALLGAVALPASPYRGSRVTLDMKELAALVQRDQDHVTPLDLASWIIANRSDYRLIDLRTDVEFGAYHIPGAEHVSVAGLLDAQLGRQDKIVLCSEGGERAAQGWMFLKAMGYTGVYVLRGGMAGWRSDVLWPTLPSGVSSSDAASVERLKSISAFFGGAIRAAGDEKIASQTLTLPKVEAPASIAGPASPVGRKKKEGC